MGIDTGARRDQPKAVMGISGRSAAASLATQTSEYTCARATECAHRPAQPQQTMPTPHMETLLHALSHEVSRDWATSDDGVDDQEDIWIAIHCFSLKVCWTTLHLQLLKVLAHRQLVRLAMSMNTYSVQLSAFRFIVLICTKFHRMEGTFRQPTWHRCGVVVIVVLCVTRVRKGARRGDEGSWLGKGIHVVCP